MRTAVSASSASTRQNTCRLARLPVHTCERGIVRSMQPGEDWLWCYTDQTLVTPPPGGSAS
jgi:hypothetical protein